jgi:hypothetical protein
MSSQVSMLFHGEIWHKIATIDNKNIHDNKIKTSSFLYFIVNYCKNVFSCTIDYIIVNDESYKARLLLKPRRRSVINRE